MSDSLAEHYLADAADRFRNIKQLADGAIAQLNEDEFFRVIDPESNSIAVIVKHISGNIRSRWTDFLTSDGEKPDRRRDSEFVSEGETRESVLQAWEAAWARLFAELRAVGPDDLLRTVTIRAEPHTVMQAINRQLTHNSYHAGQIVFLAKHLRSSAWQTLSIPRGASEQFNARMGRQHGKP